MEKKGSITVFLALILSLLLYLLRQESSRCRLRRQERRF